MLANSLIRQTVRQTRQTKATVAQSPTAIQNSRPGLLSRLRTQLSLLMFRLRYRVVDELATTEMSCVQLAFDRVRRRNVVIKMGSLKVGNEYIVNEANILQHNLHPTFPTLYKQSSAGSSSYIAIEQIKGASLHCLLSGRERLPLYKCIEIAMQVGAGLEALHTRGLGHFDVKPDNIMRGNSQTRLLDFGLARPLGPQQRPGCFGTPNYLAPEQVKSEYLDQRADIYSLGLVLFEMITQQNPMNDPNYNVEATIQNHFKVQVDLQQEHITDRIQPEHQQDLLQLIDRAHLALQSIIRLSVTQNVSARFAEIRQMNVMLGQARQLAKELAPYENLLRDEINTPESR